MLRDLLFGIGTCHKSCYSALCSRSKNSVDCISSKRLRVRANSNSSRPSAYKSSIPTSAVTNSFTLRSYISSTRLIKRRHWSSYLPSITGTRSEEHTSELQSRFDLVCRLLLEKQKNEGRLARTRERNPSPND